jgi:hypothetical protein
VTSPEIAIRLARDRVVIRGERQILAPVLLRSQVLSPLHQAVRGGELRKKDAERQLSYVHGLWIRLLEDLVFHNAGFSHVASIVAG